MRAGDSRRIALGMEGAVEGAHMGHPDFRVDNRIFTTLHHDPAFGGLASRPVGRSDFCVSIRARSSPLSRRSQRGPRAAHQIVDIATFRVDQSWKGTRLARSASALTVPSRRPRSTWFLRAASPYRRRSCAREVRCGHSSAF
jgi:hypothetical protein